MGLHAGQYIDRFCSAPLASGDKSPKARTPIEHIFIVYTPKKSSCEGFHGDPE
jgi:hypothetical protein